MKILCPTDFSAHSKVALEYAMNLANTIDAEVHVLSVFQVNKSASSMISLDDVIRQNHEEDMLKLVSGLGQLVKKDRLPMSKIMKGNTVSCITRYVKHYDIDLVIMGTQGGNSMRTILFGSTTKKLASKIDIPVLAIPETVQHKLTSNKIVLALDDKPIEKEDLFKVPLEIAASLALNIDILHIQKEEEVIPFDPSIAFLLGNCLGGAYVEQGNDPVQTIKDFVENRNIGMLIMIRREKSFLQKLLTIGNTSAELAKTNIPLMVIPE